MWALDGLQLKKGLVGDTSAGSKLLHGSFIPHTMAMIVLLSVSLPEIAYALFAMLYLRYKIVVSRLGRSMSSDISIQVALGPTTKESAGAILPFCPLTTTGLTQDHPYKSLNPYGNH